MNIATFDLNLLVVFETILRERSVTKAGARLGLSQPAVSHALNRLRWLMKDDLFIRTPEGMSPTPRAEELAQPVRRAIGELLAALQPEEFVPEHAERSFTIAVNNYAAVVLAGRIAAKAAAVAPRVKLSLRPSGTLDLSELLARGELDLAIAAPRSVASMISSQAVVEDRYVAVMRRGHPAGVKKLTMKSFAAAPHLVISSSGEDLSFVDAAIARVGGTRNIALEAPYLSASAILSQSDMIAVLGHQIAQEFSRAYPIEIAELPFKSSALRSTLFWSRRLDKQPAHRWLRETVSLVGKSLST